MFGSWTLGGKCQFLDEDGNKIGKGIIEECFEYDQQRELRNLAPLSEIREAVVILNKWSKMNVKLTKKVLSWKKLVAMATGFMNSSGFQRKIIYQRIRMIPLVIYLNWHGISRNFY